MRLISSVGKKVNCFETILSKYIGTKYAVPVINGTAALHIALLLTRVRQEDEVLIPTLSLLDLANSYNLPRVNDTSESLGNTYKGDHTTTFWSLGIMSFNGNKVITTGGGGAILTNDDELAQQAKHLTTIVKLAHRWKFFIIKWLGIIANLI
ncbi:MAG: DegT/DnrJ/EryC1/StrS family aminotransferase [Cyanobacteria bacterium LVE1205-1]